MRKALAAASLVAVVASLAQIALLVRGAGRLAAAPARDTALVGGAPAGPGAGGVFAAIRAGSFYALAGAILTDPAGYSARARQSYAEALDAADAALAAGDDGRAAAILADLGRTLGPRPDIALREALLSLLAGRPDQAVARLDTMRPLPLDHGARLFAAIDRCLAGGLDQVTRANMTRLAELADWREARARAGLPPDGVRVALEGEYLILELHIERLPEGVAALADDLDNGGAAYVQESAGLSGLAWGADLRAAAGQAVEAGAGAVLALPRDSFHGFSPTRIVVGEASHFELRGPAARAVLVGLRSYGFGRPPGACPPTLAPEACERPVYAIMPAP